MIASRAHAERALSGQVGQDPETIHIALDRSICTHAESKSHQTIYSQRALRAARSAAREPEDGVVPRARALLVGLEGMTGDIVGRLLQAEPDCEVVNGMFRRDNLLEAIREHQPSVVVVGLTDADIGPAWDELFQLYPKLLVVAVTPNGHRACLFREPLVQSLLAVLSASAESGDAR